MALQPCGSSGMLATDGMGPDGCLHRMVEDGERPHDVRVGPPAARRHAGEVELLEGGPGPEGAAVVVAGAGEGGGGGVQRHPCEVKALAHPGERHLEQRKGEETAHGRGGGGVARPLHGLVHEVEAVRPGDLRLEGARALDEDGSS